MENTAEKSYRERLIEAALNGYLDGSVCPYCNQKTELIDSSEVYHGTSYGMMYICRKCNAYVGCYDNSTRALGRLADEELRLAKRRVHEHFDRLWKEKKHTKWHRGKAYRWLSRQLDIPFEYTHIGMFDKDMCERVIEMADELFYVYGSEDIDKGISFFMDNRHSSKINMETFLYQFREEVPQWLQKYHEGTKVSFTDIMSGRIGYYPGSGFDGSLLKMGNMSHSVHSFLYVDYGVRKKEMQEHLTNPTSIRGYHSIGRIEWSMKDLFPNGLYPLEIDNIPSRYQDAKAFLFPDETPYCFTEIMERNDNRNDSWGATRLAITFLFADGIDAYYQLFCKEYRKTPWLFLLQDHGLGGNYDAFGKGGSLDAIISKYGFRPPYVMCGENTRIWEGYCKLSNVNSTTGSRLSGWYRSLYKDMK